MTCCLANSYICLIHVLNWTETVWYAADAAAAAAARVSKDLQDSLSIVFLCCFSLLFRVWCDCGFCLFCFVLLPTCVIQNQVHAEEDENDDDEEEKMGSEEKSPEEGEAKRDVKDEGSNEDEPEIPETKEASEIKPLKEQKKTDKSDAESSDKDSCKVERVLSVSSNAIDNKENETKGDDK